jgi:hypothetical protein
LLSEAGAIAALRKQRNCLIVVPTEEKESEVRKKLNEQSQ